MFHIINRKAQTMTKKKINWYLTSKISNDSSKVKVVKNNNGTNVVIVNDEDGEWKYLSDYDNLADEGIDSTNDLSEDEEELKQQLSSKKRQLLKAIKKTKDQNKYVDLIDNLRSYNKLYSYLSSYFKFFQNKKSNFMKGLANIQGFNRISQFKQALNKGSKITLSEVKSILKLPEIVKNNRKELNKLNIKTNLNTTSGVNDLLFNLQRKKTKLNSELKNLMKSLEYVEKIKNNGWTDLDRLLKNKVGTLDFDKKLEKKHGIKSSQLIDLLASSLKKNKK